MSPLKPTLKTEILSLIMIVASFVLAFYFYQNFPDQVPTHWNFRGEVDGWSSAGFGAFMIPFVILGMYLLFLVIPLIDPKKERYREFTGTYHLFKNFILFFMFIIYLIIGYSGLGYDLDISIIVSTLVGLLFIVLGSQMPKIKSNWFIGIRTPWTLSNEEVWKKTHEVGGKFFIIGGLLIIIAGLLENKFSLYIFIAAIIIAAIVPMVYSYVWYRKTEK
jgi:uncharacterized membrane protein